MSVSQIDSANGNERRGERSHRALHCRSAFLNYCVTLNVNAKELVSGAAPPVVAFTVIG